jgi:hypothetical protein
LDAIIRGKERDLRRRIEIINLKRGISKEELFREMLVGDLVDLLREGIKELRRGLEEMGYWEEKERFDKEVENFEIYLHRLTTHGFSVELDNPLL